MSTAYSINDGYPSVPDYLHLRSISGLSAKTTSQAEKIASGSWYGCFVTHGPDNTVVGMGRIIGDGGWYFHIADMAVHPEHQRKGLGDMIMKRLLQEISTRAPQDGEPYISLLADEPGRPLYRRLGFVDTLPYSLGMYLPQS